MGLASMTGFARQEGQYAGTTWTWEVKSVNARGLDVRCRLPSGLDALEPIARQKAAAAMKRGNVSINLQLAWAPTQQAVRINEQVLGQVLALVATLEQRLPGCRPSSAEGVLGLRGVIDVLDPLPAGDAREALESALLDSLDRALAALLAMRRSEGERLAAFLSAQLERLAELSEQARALASTQPAAIFARLQQQLTLLLGDTPGLTPDRLAQEAALLAAKADPLEELDRLCAHRQAAAVLLRENGPVGRQLDFLCQELNRETNTLCSKSADIELTRVGLDLKATGEQVREQVQNIE